VHEHGGEVKLTLVTPEARPMAIFGRRASAAVAAMLEQAGVEVILGNRPLRFSDGELELEGAAPIACDQVISLPAPEVPPIPGLPQGPDGFIPVDRYGGVLGVDRVYAAGDATWFPVKQGGLATQQADCVASAIAALAGAEVEPQPFQPVLRGALLTERGPRYLRANLQGPESSSAARSALWWPPAKVAGKHLAPFLADKAGYHRGQQPLADLQAPPGDSGAQLDPGHEDAVAMALTSADSSSSERDFKGALRWLEVAEDLELYLPSEYELKRISWEELAERS
jgi:sulfide:quinone oxidoreductase